jgi:hypothetical protein
LIHPRQQHHFLLVQRRTHQTNSLHL